MSKARAIAKREDEGQEIAPVHSETAAIFQMIERVARDPSVDITRMERLLQMQQDAEARRARTEFLAALAKMQAVLPAVERKGTGHNSKKYARFEDFIETIKPHLAAHGFSLSFRVAQTDNAIRITGVLGHEAGHQETTDLSLPADNTGNKNAVQAWGSSISYGKRYVGLTLLGVATEDEDDDAKAAGEPAYITEAQQSIIRDKIDELGADIEKFCAYFEIDGIAKIPAKHFQRAMDALNAKARRA